MDTLGVALVVAGVVIAGCSLAALAVVALVACVPWSRFRPRYQRGTAPDQRPGQALVALRRSVRDAADRVRGRLVRARPVSRHPRGARHLIPLGR